MNRPASRVLRAGCVLIGILALAGMLSTAWAAPVVTLLRGEGPPGIERFAADLSRLWRNRSLPTPELLNVRVLADAESRLRALERGRGEFAIVDAATAARQLPAFPGLTAVAVLWPEVVHALTRNPAVQQVSLPPPVEYWVLDNAPYLYDALRARLRGQNAALARISLVPLALLPDALDFAETPVTLVSAPVPLEEVREALGRGDGLRLLGFDAQLLEDTALDQPWLATQTLPPGTYPGQERPVEVPARYQVLIGTRRLPDATVQKMLDTVYGKAVGAAVQNPLFAQVNGNMNAVFSKLMPFHPATAKAFNFEPSVP